jgi:hypothetical protein
MISKCSAAKNEELFGVSRTCADMYTLYGTSGVKHDCKGTKWDARCGTVCCARMPFDSLKDLRTTHAGRTTREKQSHVAALLAASMMKNDTTGIKYLEKIRVHNMPGPVCKNCFSLMYMVQKTTFRELCHEATVLTYDEAMCGHLPDYCTTLQLGVL